MTPEQKVDAQEIVWQQYRNVDRMMWFNANRIKGLPTFSNNMIQSNLNIAIMGGSIMVENAGR